MTIRWGLLGCGDIARKRVARALLEAPDSELRIACRRDANQLNAFCQDFGVPHATTREAELINHADVDAVYIATPVKDHLPQTLAAAKAGKHVLVEKPMALSVAECQQMIDACKQHGVSLGVAYYRRFYPIVARMKELLASGTLGTPLAIAAVTSTAFDLNPGEEGYWRVEKNVGGGGALMDVGSHRLNLFLDLFGPVTHVHALCDTLTGDFEGEDCASLILRFQTGAHGSLQCFFGTSVDADEFTITGSKGRLIASPLNGARLIVQTGGEQRDEQHPPAENLHEPLVADFVRALIEQRPPRVSGEEGLLTNAVMARAYAAHSGELGV